MKLTSAASYFDRLVCTDAYDPKFTFKGQIDVFDDSKRDGVTVERRILSVAPDVEPPPRKTITFDGLTWLIGTSQRDYYKQKPIRHKHILHIAEAATVKTFLEALAGSAGLVTNACRVWVKSSKEPETSSDQTGVYDIYFQPAESVAENQLISISGRWHLVRSTYASAAGFFVALSDELEEPVVTTATFKNRTYVPLSDSFTTATTTIPFISIRWQSFFKYLSRASHKFAVGDTVGIIRKSDGTPEAGDIMTVGGIDLLVLAIIDESTCWSLHLRDA